MAAPLRITAVLFDLDDTLLDSFTARVAALHAAFESHGLGHLSAEDLVRRLHGRQYAEALADLCGGPETAGAVLSAYREAYWRKRPGLIRLFSGIPEAVQRLHSSRVKLGVVTQKERAFNLEGRLAGAAQELVEVGLGEAISLTIGFEDVSRHKPDPEGVFLALQRLGAEPEETLFVGDSAADMAAAQAAGCWSVHATWGIPHGGPGLNGIKPHDVIGDPASLFALGRFISV